MRATGFFLSITAAALSALLLTSGCRHGGIAGEMSTAQENDIGGQYAAEIAAHMKVETDGKINRRVRELSEPVFAQANKDRNDVTFRIRVIDDKALNAFSLPGGYIYINSGLLDKLGADDDAIACVIGHEAAHVVCRHIVKQISKSQNNGLLINVAAVLTHSRVVGDVGSTVADAYDLHYGREDEYEADRYGERFAYNAGYDPAGMQRVFNLLSADEKAHGAPPAYMRDHPINKNRALRALEQMRELRANKGEYVSDQYNENGARLAAEKNGINYAQLVLATPPPQPLETAPLVVTHAPIPEAKP